MYMYVYIYTYMYVYIYIYIRGPQLAVLRPDDVLGGEGGGGADLGGLQST